MDKRYQIFVSSTYEDLKNERAKVMETILNFDCFPAGMERFPAMSVKTFEYIKKIIDDSDYFLLIIGGRYGSVDKSSGISWTEQEFDYAVSKGIPIMVFNHKDFTTLPGYKIEQQVKNRKKLVAFKKKVSEGKLINFWTNADDLALAVAKSLPKVFEQHPQTGWVKANTVVSSDSPEDIKSIKVDKYKKLASAPKVATPIQFVSLEKKYEPRMNEFLNYVSFRIEFFSRPEFEHFYMTYLENEFPNIQVKEKVLSRVEMQLIDIDTIAFDLNVPFDFINATKVNMIDDIIVAKLHSKVYITPHYICIFIPIDIDEGGIISEETLESDVKRIFKMKILNDFVGIQNISCIVNHHLKMTPQKMCKWDVLDKNAFPQICPNEINSGRYADSHQTQDGINHILIREIMKGRSEETDKISLYVSISSISTYDDLSFVNFNENYQELFNLTLNEVGRCLK